MKMCLKFSSLTAAAALLCAGVVSAQAGAPTTEFRCQPGETYYMDVMMSGIEYWKPVYETMKQAAHALGCKTAYTGTSEYDVTKELASFEQILTKKPAGILLHPMNADPFIEPIDRASAAGVPVVTFAADSPKSKRIAFVAGNDDAESRTAADLVAKDMKGKGEYAVLENPGQSNHDVRVKSFIAEMTEKYPDIKLVARAATLQDPNKAYTAVQNFAQAHPNLGAVFMPEATSAMGAAQASIELGNKIRVMCVDVNAKVLDLIKSGQMFGAMQTNVGMQGYYGFIALFLAAHPGLVDPMNDYQKSGVNPFTIPFIDNGFQVVTKDNADAFYWDAYLKRTGTKGVDE